MIKRTSIALALALSTSAVPSRPLAHLEKMGPHCLMLYAQESELPAPGNPGHKEPAPGEHCVHDASDAAHNCACHRECKQNTDEDGNLVDGAHVQEDAKCRVYCFKDHCHCPVENCD
ncbi:MAG TPA: hypothetical protein VLV86_14120 [Vicinamibacterales bacterium]|nr:hypothetical protein [Vicinamibacterales bacterium]